MEPQSMKPWLDLFFDVRYNISLLIGIYDK